MPKGIYDLASLSQYWSAKCLDSKLWKVTIAYPFGQHIHSGVVCLVVYEPKFYVLQLWTLVRAELCVDLNDTNDK